MEPLRELRNVKYWKEVARNSDSQYSMLSYRIPGTCDSTLDAVGSTVCIPCDPQDAGAKVRWKLEIEYIENGTDGDS